MFIDITTAKFIQKPKEVPYARFNEQWKRKISTNSRQLKGNGSAPGETASLHIYPMRNGISEGRSWYNYYCFQKVNKSDLRVVHF